MKSIIAIITIIILGLMQSYSQITKITVGKNVQHSVVPYDSLNNFLGENVYQYIGQTLYLNENVYAQENGYGGFHTKPFWNRTDKEFVYKPFRADRSRSDYNALKMKNFEVLEVIKIPEKYGWGVPFCLKLLDVDSQEIVYFQYETNFNDFPFIVLGYFEKLKQLYIGKKYIWEHSCPPLFSLSTQERIEYVNNSEWECVDIAIKDDDYSIICVFENNIIGKAYIYLSTFTGFDNPLKDKDKFIKQRIEAEKLKVSYIKEFGEEFGKLIYMGQVKIGMTKKMCRLAWGEPQAINETQTDNNIFEQWVYGLNKYLYFDDDILVTIQKIDE